MPRRTAVEVTPRSFIDQSRVQGFLIHSNDMLRLMDGEISMVLNQLPVDAEIVSAYYDFNFRSIAIIVWSMAYKVVPPGNRIEYHDTIKFAVNDKYVNRRPPDVAPRALDRR